MPKLSIITINYNNFEGLKRTIESVVNQTWQEFEYLVIDGGSTDGSAAYIESKSEHIDYWVSEPDQGVYYAMNKGIKVATGKYLLFLNSGDILNNDNVLLALKKSLLLDMNIVYGDLWIVGEQGKGFRNRYPDFIDFPFLKQTSLGHPSTFIKKELFQTYGLYRTDLKIVSDWAFFVKVLCRHNVSHLQIDHIIATFYEGGLSTASVYHQQHIEERKKVLKENFDIYDASFEELIMKFEQQKELVNKLDQGIEILVTNKQLLKILNSIIRLFALILKKKRS
nr:glycosyltransferase family 2 protein [uncultured Flavobacterium sp.]